MNCLFLMEDYPISRDAAGGGSSVFYSHLEFLAHSGCQIDLAMLEDPGRSRGFAAFTGDQPEIWRRVLGWCRSYCMVEAPAIDRPKAPLRHLGMSLFDPSAYLCPRINEESVANLRRAVTDLRPDLIWAEHLFPALMAARLGLAVPIIYAHHDWEWRLRGLRGGGGRSGRWRWRYDSWLTRRMEARLVRIAAGCVSVSATEAEEIRGLGSSHAEHLPTTCEPGPPADPPRPDAPVRIVHLGGMKTTANRIGLRSFLDVAWPRIAARDTIVPELWVIGGLDGAPADLVEALGRAGAVCPGFVSDLRRVLRPYDLHIIPWGFNTGARTRIPQALAHSQVLVSTEAAAACLAELRTGHDCVLVPGLDAMAEAILDLLPDPDRRARLGDSGRRTAIDHFTREPIQPRFDHFLHRVANAPTGAPA